MVRSCMNLTFGFLVLLCPFGLTRPVFVSYWCNIHAVRGRVKLFATEENVAKQEDEEEEAGKEEEGFEIELRVRDFFFFFVFVFTQGALN